MPPMFRRYGISLRIDLEKKSGCIKYIRFYSLDIKYPRVLHGGILFGSVVNDQR